jgi:hypothetical protein
MAKSLGRKSYTFRMNSTSPGLDEKRTEGCCRDFRYHDEESGALHHDAPNSPMAGLL